MIHLVFIRSAGPQRSVVQSSPLRITRNTLTLGKTSAVYHGPHWHLGRQDFHVLRVDTAVLVHFETANQHSESHGPFSRLALVGGMLVSSLGGDSLAELNANDLLWKDSAGVVWEAVVLSKL